MEPTTGALALRKHETWWEREAPENFLSDALRKDRRFVFGKVASLIKGSTVLDAGCGTCAAYPVLKELGFTYSGIDPTEKFLNYAREVYPKINVRRASILDIPFEDGYFDTVFCQEVLDHVHPDDWSKAINELARVAEWRLILGLIYSAPNGPTKVIEKDYLATHFNEGELLKIIRRNPRFARLCIDALGPRRFYVIDLADSEC